MRCGCAAQRKARSHSHLHAVVCLPSDLPTQSPSKSASSAAAPASAAAALDFFGNATPAAAAASSSSPAAARTPSKQQHQQQPQSATKSGSKRKRASTADEDDEPAVKQEPTSDQDDEENDAEEEQMLDDGANDLDDAEGDEEEGGGVQLFNRAHGTAGSGSDDDVDAAGTADSPAASAARSLKSLRRSLGIHVSGSDIPPPFIHFADLSGEALRVPQFIVDNLSRPVLEGGAGYKAPTPIQQQAVPILMKGRELLACAPTGSGKTAAFAIPILAALGKPGASGVGFRALVLSPTRELAEQTHRCFTALSHGRAFKIFHLSKANANANTFGSQGTTKRDILITTPMRLVNLIQQECIDLSAVEYLVLDEADRLFELGFLEQVDTVMSACSNPKLRRALFSATMMQGVETLARTVLRDPIRLTIGARNSATSSIKQDLVFVSSEEGKLLAFRQMIQRGLEIPVLIFVQSKDRAAQLYNELVYENLQVDVIHADLTAHQRSESIRKFRAGAVWVLICTDLMARGIDFKGVRTVLNYDFPQSLVSYIHRIGRTGRAGHTGRAITFFTEIDTPLLGGVARIVKASGSEVPEWMLRNATGSASGGLHRMSVTAARRLKDQAPPRASIQPKDPATKAKASANKKARDRKKKRKSEGAGAGAGADGAGSAQKAEPVPGRTAHTSNKRKSHHNE